MTTWQWNVILALCRLMLALMPQGKAITVDQSTSDLNLIEEAIRRSEIE